MARHQANQMYDIRPIHLHNQLDVEFGLLRTMFVNIREERIGDHDPRWPRNRRTIQVSAGTLVQLLQHERAFDFGKKVRSSEQGTVKLPALVVNQAHVKSLNFFCAPSFIFSPFLEHFLHRSLFANILQRIQVVIHSARRRFVH
jgi:hypothetical protein